MEWQRDELLLLVERSLTSQTVEWAINIQICDLVTANPDFSPLVLERLGSSLRASSSDGKNKKAAAEPAVKGISSAVNPWLTVSKDKRLVQISLALGLLEMLIKNCGIIFVR